MQRLKHPIRSITEPFGKAGLTVAILALVMALVGGAYAAGGLTKSQEKQVTKIAKKYAGKPGAPGAAGPAGAPGAAGKNGTNGTNGANGKSVVLKNTEPENCANEEGLTYEVEGSGSKNEVCRGPEGSPWTAAGTLPVGATEKGEWRIAQDISGEEEAATSISFTVPLSAALGETKVHLIKPSDPLPTGCTGTVAEPGAAAGNLCVFAKQLPAVIPIVGPISTVEGPHGADPAGAQLEFFPAATGEFSAKGSWAVTG